MASVTVTRSFIDPGSQSVFERIQRRLKAGARPVRPVVDYFAREWLRSIHFDFRVGGRSPFVWKANARNTVAAKGHGRPLIGKDGSTKLRDAVRVNVTEAGSGAGTRYKVDARVPQVGEWNQAGTDPYTIRPKRPGGLLRFEVAEERSEFIARRTRSIAKRRAGVRVAIPSRPGKVVVYAKSVNHPGIPARRFIVVREGLIREAWRQPLRRYLFEGVVPR